MPFPDESAGRDMVRSSLSSAGGFSFFPLFVTFSHHPLYFSLLPFSLPLFLLPFFHSSPLSTTFPPSLFFTIPLFLLPLPTQLPFTLTLFLPPSLSLSFHSPPPLSTLPPLFDIFYKGTEWSRFVFVSADMHAWVCLSQFTRIMIFIP